MNTSSPYSWPSQSGGASGRDLIPFDTVDNMFQFQRGSWSRETRVNSSNLQDVEYSIGTFTPDQLDSLTSDVERRLRNVAGQLSLAEEGQGYPSSGTVAELRDEQRSLEYLRDNTGLNDAGSRARNDERDRYTLPWVGGRRKSRRGRKSKKSKKRKNISRRRRR
jgi:hypothetical protein